MALPNHGRIGTAGMQAALFHARENRRERQNAGTGTVDLSGTAQEGETLTATFNDDDPNGAASGVTYQWLRGDVDAIPGADAATYDLTSDDVGFQISVVVHYTDPQNNVEHIRSARSDAVIAA